MVLPPRLAQKIQFSSVLIGSLSVVLSIVIGILAVVIGYRLPAATWATTGLVTMMGALSAFFYFFSGVTLAFAPAYVKNGHLNVTFATRARRVLVTLFGGTILTTIISMFFFTGTVSASVRTAGDPIYRQLYGDQPVGCDHWIPDRARYATSTVRLQCDHRVAAPAPSTKTAAPRVRCSTIPSPLFRPGDRGS
ncbi:hypothetical protein AB0H34_18670 [Saccharopolyspora shandongensis]|uniref:hypothetical protein n=1 Tax=Saccharopolyspora shandongensis TaxID=418495 RepID=UPI0033C38C23